MSDLFSKDPGLFVLLTGGSSARHLGAPEALIATIGLLTSCFASLTLILREIRPIAASKLGPDDNENLGAHVPLENPVLPRLRDMPLIATLLLHSAWGSLLHKAIFSASLNETYFPFLHGLSVAQFAISAGLAPYIWAASAKKLRTGDLRLFKIESQFMGLLNTNKYKFFERQVFEQKIHNLSLKIFSFGLPLFISTSLSALAGPIGLAFFLPLAAAWGGELCDLLEPLIDEPAPPVPRRQI